MPDTKSLTIGALAARTGLSVSAIRFYEEKGLVEPFRSSGGQRRFLRSDIRRLSFVLIAQQLGLSIGEIERQLVSRPHGRTPTQSDWTRISKAMRQVTVGSALVALRKGHAAHGSSFAAMPRQDRRPPLR